jgi:WXG100 family type VII secretion target
MEVTPLMNLETGETVHNAMAPMGGAGVDGTALMVKTELESAPTYIDARVEAITQLLQSLVAQLEPVEETWSGWASNYYEPLQEEWNLAANGLFGPDGVLSTISNTLRTTWSNYDSAESANIGTWNLAGQPQLDIKSGQPTPVNGWRMDTTIVNN